MTGSERNIMRKSGEKGRRSTARKTRSKIATYGHDDSGIAGIADSEEKRRDGGATTTKRYEWRQSERVSVAETKTTEDVVV